MNSQIDPWETYQSRRSQKYRRADRQTRRSPPKQRRRQHGRWEMNSSLPRRQNSSHMADGSEVLAPAAASRGMEGCGQQFLRRTRQTTGQQLPEGEIHDFFPTLVRAETITTKTGRQTLPPSTACCRPRAGQSCRKSESDLQTNSEMKSPHDQMSSLRPPYSYFSHHAILGGVVHRAEHDLSAR